MQKPKLEITHTGKCDTGFIEPVLCYIDGNWAYFTTQEISEQYGDDWDDSPYECNAGSPYGSKDGLWTIIKVAWDGAFDTPSDTSHLAEWSVEQINSGAIPWLKSYSRRFPQVRIMAGTTLSEFIRMIESAGGTIYLRKSKGE